MFPLSPLLIEHVSVFLIYLSQLLEGNFALFITYALGHRNDFQNILLVIMVSLISLTH